MVLKTAASRRIPHGIFHHFRVPQNGMFGSFEN
jgi:hypothetical protein